jgi:hypothetical protein
MPADVEVTFAAITGVRDNVRRPSLRVELPGQPALWGIIERMMEFGLRLIALRVLTVP